ncbi:UDP-glycosyltransferase 74B1-like [Malania oleifera]|uniref:UDP-glycosyltransferase 74B1-like n=1 Tax=Malania oleifera TaxID=397392 RepID=UPI0025ADF6CC|nr:UDP-glycosyltransferase 74B1-like [Malania oleifera]
MESQRQRGHVVVLTYPAQGHINPLLQFAKRLAFKGLKATLATTPYTINSIRADTVGIEAISDGFDQGGFEHAPSADDYLESFKTVGSRTLAELILKFKDSASPVDCLVYDSQLPWGLDVAKKLGIRVAAFITGSAALSSILWHVHCGALTVPVNPEALPVSLPGLPPLGFSELPTSLVNPSGMAAYLTPLIEQISTLDQHEWVFANTFEELESELAKAMSRIWRVLMVGPMLPSAYLDQQIEGDTCYGASLWKSTDDQCSRWLETKSPNSVIYVSFGSMGEVADKQVDEVAWGLKASNKNFLWVVKESERGKLPVKFVGSIGGMGLVVTWCDQLKVLAHQAVGCFITHCGWNSTLEGLSLGVPMVGMPQRVDQPTNAKFVEVWNVGMRAKRDEEGIVSREELEMCIREVMDGERSEDIKRNAFNWRELAMRAVSTGGSSDNIINKFVEVLREGRQN